MKSVLLSIAALLASLAPAPSWAQTPGPGGTPAGRRPFLRAPSSTPPPTDDRVQRVYTHGEELPAPVEVAEDAPPPMPAEPLGPYLLTTEAGPFMVNAQIFRGQYAVRQAHILAIELRRRFNLPAYVYFLKLKPGNHNVRGVPPTAPPGVVAPPIEDPTITDEAVVLVGHCKTIDEAGDLRKYVKKLAPNCLAGAKSIFPWRNAATMGRATVTTNPMVPAEEIFPGRPSHGAGHASGHHGAPPPGAVVDPEVLRSSFRRPTDPMVVRMNRGADFSLYECPAPYTLVVSELSGRATLNQNDSSFFKTDFLKRSPLKTAHEDAIQLARQLSRHPDIRRMGLRPYVYHDREASYVTLGEFQSPDDPAIEQLRRAAIDIELETKGKGGKEFFRKYLAPASTAFEVPRP